ncbi:MAG: aspartate aminotransferase family protein [Myxococcales bacterium]|nr:aspartate aminotransferase family protein [Myxococcales bacterium]
MNNAELLARREHLLGKGAPLFYDEPVHLVRGEGVWLYAADGKRYLDAYNNVPHVGHCHPHVVEALSRQAATLNVHTRYLDETILNYAERLCASFDDRLSSVLFVCTGSEANDQALRLARHCTGGRGMICTDMTYHGNTTAVDEISPLFRRGRSLTPDVRTIPFPDSYRPLRGLAEPELAAAYADEVSRAIEGFAADGIPFAGMLVCPIFANEGLPEVSPRFLAMAAERVREAGGVFIADEVQSGFGRTGRMWGHEWSEVVPDIVTLGKPMGNGHPLAAVVARRDLVDKFRAEVFYFNTFGGNPVSCAVGNAVLDVMERDHLVEHASRVGDFVRDGLLRLQQSHPLIGDIRGKGLWIGVELVRSSVTKEPAADECRRIMNRMKEEGVLLGRIGPFDNVLKIRPPMVFSEEHAEILLDRLGTVLEEL